MSDKHKHPTLAAQAFMKENDRSPVVSGAAFGGGGKGGRYTLQNGKSFSLNITDCVSLPPPYPKWKQSHE